MTSKLGNPGRVPEPSREGLRRAEPGSVHADPAGQQPQPRRRRHLAVKRHPKGQVRAEINVTPLVDVTLVLLIIFMVVTPMIVRGVSVELPLTSHHDRKNDDNKDLIVSINASGDIYVNADKVPPGGLTAAVAEERRRHPDKGVFIKADRRIHYGAAREVMESIHRAGVEDVQLGTEERKSAAGSAEAAR